MSYTIQKDTSQILLKIQDELTVADVKRFKEDLLEAVSDPLPIVVDAKEATRIDLSIVQVLHTLRGTAGKLTVQGCPDGIKSYLAWAGVPIDRWAAQPSHTNASVNGEHNE
jgi:hypothetical protein